VSALQVFRQVTRGIEHVFHQPNGKRDKSHWLDRRTFKEILKDAGVSGRVPHHFKDVVQSAL
jgi:hypothetical protein